MKKVSDKVKDNICRDHFILGITQRDLTEKYELGSYDIYNIIDAYSKEYLMSVLGEDTIRSIVLLYKDRDVGRKNKPTLTTKLGLPAKTIRHIATKFRFLDGRDNLTVTFTKRCVKCNQLYKATLESEHDCG